MVTAPISEPSQATAPIEAPSEARRKIEVAPVPTARSESRDDAASQESAPDDKPLPDETAYPETEKKAIRRNLSGWVFDQAGEPVADLGVDAVARRLMPASATAPVGGSDDRHRTVTNGNGHFGFPRLLDGEYEVRTADTEIYEPVSSTLRAGIDSAVLVVTAKTNRSVLVRGLVESARGDRLAGVRVIPIGRSASAVWTGESGDYELRLPVDDRQASHVLRFLREGYRDLRLSLSSSELQGVEETRLDARLDPIEGEAKVTGTVIGSNGLALAGAQLQLYSAALMRRETAVSDHDGRFIFPAVQLATDYRLWVRPRQGYRDFVEEGLIVDPGGRDLAIVVQTLELASLRGRMVDPEGAAVPGVSLWLRTAYEGPGSVSAVTGGPQGDFFVERLPEGPLTLQTHASPYFSITGIDLSAGTVTQTRLVLDTGSYRLGGFVLGAGGEPVPGAQISLRWSRTEGGVLSRSHRQTTTDAGGYFLFTQLGAGPHSLTASAKGYRGARFEQHVGANETDVVIHLQQDSGP